MSLVRKTVKEEAASACCAGPALGPLVVSVFGAGGAVALEGFRPYAVPLLILSGLAGTAYQRILPVAGGPAWDVYMLFAPGIVWNGADPPKPAFWMHQLGITNAPRLDANVFAQRARQML